MNSWLSKLKSGLSKSSANLSGGISDIFTKRKLDEEALQDLEEVLIMADLGVETSAKIIENFSDKKFDKDITPENVKAALAEEIAEILKPSAVELDVAGKQPAVVMVVGVNGNGKTTSIGKLAYIMRNRGLKVQVAAADTFRAAAVDQLKTWGERAGVKVYEGAANQDPASVVYQSVSEAIKDKADLLLVDTAGRLQNKSNLMQELTKIKNVCAKLIPDAPHEVILVLDATTGQNALSQVKEFGDKAGLTGLIVTKLDGTARGGVVVALANEFKLPVYAIGVGEGIEDMQPFKAEDFARNLLNL